jgi:sugar phosphate isomerase/epimerase
VHPGGPVVELHADDPKGFGPGSGEQDYGAIYDALDYVGFDGYVTVEFHAFLGDEVPDEDPIELAERSLDYLRSVRS